MLGLLYALKAFAGHTAEGSKKKTEEFEKENQTPRTFVTFDTSHLINRHFPGGGINCVKTFLPPHTVFFFSCSMEIFDPLSSSTESLFCPERMTHKMGVDENIT